MSLFDYLSPSLIFVSPMDMSARPMPFGVVRGDAPILLCFIAGVGMILVSKGKQKDKDVGWGLRPAGQHVF